MATPAGYTRTQIRLHWIIVGLVALQYVFKGAISQAWADWLNGAEIAFNPMIAQHVFLGALVALLTIWRLALRFSHGAPAPAGVESAPGKAKVALATQWAFYALLLLMPISGSVAWFGGAEGAATAHNILKFVLLALIALHVVGALVQQFVQKTNVMARMKHPVA